MNRDERDIIFLNLKCKKGDRWWLTKDHIGSLKQITYGWLQGMSTN
jgi:hypothetical protein